MVNNEEVGQINSTNDCIHTNAIVILFVVYTYIIYTLTRIKKACLQKNTQEIPLFSSIYQLLRVSLWLNFVTHCLQTLLACALRRKRNKMNMLAIVVTSK